jgi:hypothetical protein
MADDLIAVIEKRESMPLPSSVRAAMELLVRASATGVIDPDVLRTRHRLAMCLAAKPSTTAAGRELGSKIGEAVLGLAGRALHVRR